MGLAAIPCEGAVNEDDAPGVLASPSTMHLWPYGAKAVYHCTAPYQLFPSTSPQCSGAGMFGDVLLF